MILPFTNKKKKTVLVLDDDVAIIHLISMVLKKMDINAITTSDAAEAIKIAKVKKPDLIIVDLKMPVMDGFEVCTILKNDPTTKDIPVVLLTGSSKTGDVDQGYSCGICDYILKPINFERFSIKVSKLLKIDFVPSPV